MIEDKLKEIAKAEYKDSWVAKLPRKSKPSDKWVNARVAQLREKLQNGEDI